MKNRIIQLIVLSILPLVLLGTDHLIISEVVLTPSGGEYVVITNPTGNAINLGNYYITDGTDVANGKYYYNLPDSTDYMESSSTDFTARFPDTNLVRGESLILNLARLSDYVTEYGSNPDLTLKDDMLPAIAGQSTFGSSPYAKLNETIGESLVLFYWDQTDSIVQDVDYLVWGADSSSASTFMIDKSVVPGYQADTPAGSQSYAPTHALGQKLVRNSDEGTETTAGGNGITGHDETSENLADTWSVVDLTSTKPVISNVTISPSDPTTEEDMVVEADVVDTTGLGSVVLTYTFPSSGGTPVNVNMSNSAGDTWSASIPATGTAGTLAYYITATNTSGLSASTSIFGVDVADPPTPLTIQTIIDNSSTYLGTVVTLNAVVSIGSGILRTDRTDMYIQDNSGYGLNMNQTGLITPALFQGDSIRVTGTVDEYQGALQITDFNYTLIDQDRPVPNIAEISTEDLNSLQFAGRFVKISGLVSSRADNVGGGSNIVVEDGYGQVTLRIWDTTRLLTDATADSLLQVGNLVDVWGVADEYNGEGQLMVAYAGDVQPLKEGEDGEGGTKLVVAPYPFDPLRGERIKYWFSFPENAHITIRVFDLSGRFITTLFDGYRTLALEVDRLWDGRTETYKVVPPGTYIIHLETVNRVTGEILHDTAPVVVGTKVK